METKRNVKKHPPPVERKETKGDGERELKKERVDENIGLRQTTFLSRRKKKVTQVPKYKV